MDDVAGLQRREAGRDAARDGAARHRGNTRSIPAWGKARLHGMIANRPDWTLSRQRQWGVPLPFFVAQGNRRAASATRSSCSSRSRSAVEQGGIEAWQTATHEDCSAPTPTQYAKINDTLDVWFDSGSTHQTVMGGPDGRMTHAARIRRHGFPADLYLEGSDQHRGWFHSSLLVVVHAERRAAVQGAADARLRRRRRGPQDVEVEGQRRRAAEGRRTRWAPRSCACGSAATDYSGELSISDEILKRVVESYRRIRNTLRFLLANTADFDPAKRRACRSREWLEIDRYALALTRALQPTPCTGDYARYEFHLVVQRLQTFCSEDLGGFYLDILKDRLYTTAQDSPRAALGADRAVRTSRRRLLRLMAPILSLHRGGSVARSCIRDERDASSARPGRRAARAAAAGPTRCSRSWDAICASARAVQKELEDAARRRQIGSSLQAEVDDRGAGADLRRAGEPGRRPALRADHVARAMRDARRAALDDRRHAERACEVRALLALPRRRRRRRRASRRCAAAASPICSAPASRARTHDGLQRVALGWCALAAG